MRENTGWAGPTLATVHDVDHEQAAHRIHIASFADCERTRCSWYELEYRQTKFSGFLPLMTLESDFPLASPTLVMDTADSNPDRCVAVNERS